MRFFKYLLEAVFKPDMKDIDKIITELESYLTKNKWFLAKQRTIWKLNSKFSGHRIFFIYEDTGKKLNAGINTCICNTNTLDIYISINSTFLKLLKDKSKWKFLKSELLSYIEHELVHRMQYQGGMKQEILDDTEDKALKYYSDNMEIMAYAKEIATHLKRMFKTKEKAIKFFDNIMENPDRYQMIYLKNSLFPHLLQYARLFDKNSKTKKSLREYVLEYLD